MRPSPNKRHNNNVPIKTINLSSNEEESEDSIAQKLGGLNSNLNSVLQSRDGDRVSNNNGGNGDKMTVSRIRFEVNRARKFIDKLEKNVDILEKEKDELD